MADSSKTVDKMMAIVRSLSDGRIVSAKDLADDLDMNRTVVQRLLATLLQRDYVARLGGEGYALSFQVLALSRLVLPELRDAARPVMREVAARRGETVTLHVVDGADAVVVAEQTAPDAVLSVRHMVGARTPLGRGAGGKVLLAFAAGRARPRIEGDVDGPAELAEIRRAGFASSRDELQSGVQGVAAPVLDPAGTAVACISILVPTSRNVDVVDWASDAVGAARQISARFATI